MTNRLRMYRKRMGFTQKQAAEILGYRTRSRVAELERGRRLPSLKTALRLEIVYRIPVAFLYPDLYAHLKRPLRAREEKLRLAWGGAAEDTRD
jgi:transcriptional regulator with XRE-family HTH domain